MRSPEEISRLANVRLEEAEILLNNGKYDGAFYLAGYIVELTLKARLCTQFGIPNLFDEEDSGVNSIDGVSIIRKVLKTHNLKVLLILSGLMHKILVEKTNNETILFSYSHVILRWNEGARYQSLGSFRKKNIEKLLISLKAENGLLQWIRKN